MDKYSANMKIQYRIAERNGNYYPHVRTKKFLFWSSWKKIAKFGTTYDLYSLSNTSCPKTEE